MVTETMCVSAGEQVIEYVPTDLFKTWLKWFGLLQIFRGAQSS